MRTLLVTTILLSGLLLGSARALAADGVVEGLLPPEQRGQIEVVYVEHAGGDFKPATAVMDQRNLAYVPHVLPVLSGTTVRFQSHDRELHNVFARGPDHRVLFNLAVLPHMQMEETFKTLGVTTLTCNVHKTMLAYVLVLQNPYFAVPDAGGRWRIRLPAGRYVIRSWGEQLDDGALARGFPVEVAAGGDSRVTFPSP